MSMRRFLFLLAPVLVLVLTVLGFVMQGNALAQPETEERELVSANPRMDCSTNPAYDNKYIASAFKAGGHALGRNQQCSSCHRSDSPVAGTGDRPTTRYGTTLIENLLSKPVTYHIRIGNKGEWEKFELEPGKVRRHTWNYDRANQNRSPEYWIKYEGGPENGPRTLSLAATPNKHLGSVYFFDRDEQDGEIYLYRPRFQATRR